MVHVTVEVGVDDLGSFPELNRMVFAKSTPPVHVSMGTHSVDFSEREISGVMEPG